MIYFITNQTVLFKEEDADIVVEYNFSTLIEWLKGRDYIEFDTETTGLSQHNDKLICYQVGDEHTQFIIEGQNIHPCVVKALQDPNVAVYMQNGKFDLGFCFVQGVVVTNVKDTFIAETLINNTIFFDSDEKELNRIRRGLDALAERYLGVELDKSIRGNILREGLTQRVVKYSADDVRCLKRIYDKQFEIIKKQKQEKCLELENRYVVALAYIEFMGPLIDKEALTHNTLCNKRDLKAKYIEIAYWLRDNGYGRYVNIQEQLFDEPNIVILLKLSSSKDMIKLFNMMGVDTKVQDKKTREIKDSVEEGVLLKNGKHIGFTKLYLEYKELEKEISTYGDKFLSNVNPKTGRIHCQYTQIQTTGRISSSGPNLQNIPAKDTMRKCFTVPKGKVMVGCDYSQQEPVVNVEISCI